MAFGGRARTKVGAFTTCLGCQFTPKHSKELAKSILFSDQVADPAVLDEAISRLRADGEVEFDPRAVDEGVAVARASPQDLRMPLGCAIVWYAPLVILALLVIVLVGLLTYLKWWAA